MPPNAAAAQHRPLPWQDAWHDALYGPTGFYRQQGGPAGHFTTSTHGALGAVLAEAIAALADRENVKQILDIGCGRGELLSHLARQRPDLLLSGVDVVDRPMGLPEPIQWWRSPGGAALPPDLIDLDATLVVAHEWLDVVPCPIVAIDDSGEPRVVLVDPRTGTESLGGPPASPDREWIARWWPNAVAGHRIEVGLTRDQAYADLCRRVRSGAVLAVDYGHTAAHRPRHGTLTAFRSGVQTLPIPDGSCDVTAHVALDSLSADEVITQRDALAQLGIDGARPPHDLSRTQPATYLHALARSSTVAALSDPAGFGGFGWALSRLPGSREASTRHTADWRL